MMHYQKIISPRGYIALMATIIISLALLGMVAQESLSGWYMRFIVLGSEAKEEANALAEGCAEEALVESATDPSYAGGAVTFADSDGGGTCSVVSVARNAPQVGQVIVIVQTAVRGAYAVFKLTADQASGKVISVREISASGQ